MSLKKLPNSATGTRILFWRPYINVAGGQRLNYAAARLFKNALSLTSMLWLILIFGTLVVAVRDSSKS